MVGFNHAALTHGALRSYGQGLPGALRWVPTTREGAAMPARKQGLYANIHAKQERIAHGSGEKMRKPGSEGAPTAEAFEEAAKTEKGKAAKAPKKQVKRR